MQGFSARKFLNRRGHRDGQVSAGNGSGVRRGLGGEHVSDAMADPREEGRQRVAVGLEVHGDAVGTNTVGGQSIWICELFY